MKPENILISSDGHLKISDFGVSRFTESNFDIFDCGAPFNDREGDKYYIAPEVLEGRTESCADIFSLGLILLEMLTFIDLPSSGEGWEILRKNPKEYILENVDSQFTSLLISMLDPIPYNRPTANEILTSLRSIYG